MIHRRANSLGLHMSIRHWIQRHRRWIVLAAVLALALSVSVSTLFLPLQAWMQYLIAAADRAGVWGMVLFIAANALASALLIPGWIFTATAGLVYGVGRGALVAHAGAMAGAGLAFLCGRYLFRKRVLALLEHNQQFRKIDAAIGREGWKIVCLVRLSPVVPFFLQNYLYSVTSIRFWPYFISTVLCTFPGTLLYVYLGAAGRYGVLDKEAPTHPMQWVLLGVGFLATIGGGWYLRRIGRKALSERDAES
jgi:uncharacterized membrane protein YdjX (TVP38/TMEM64 family)